MCRMVNTAYDSLAIAVAQVPHFEFQPIVPMNQAIVIHNQSAGSAAGLDEAIERLARRHGCQRKSLSDRTSLAAVVEAAVQTRCSRVIVAGGDGTIARVVNLLLPRFPHVELGIVPLGTGNDLARSLDLPIDDVELAFSIAATRPATAIDVVRVEKGSTSYFVNAATGGFGGETSEPVNSADKQLWGPFAYWFAALAKFVEMRVFQLRLTLDGETCEQPVFGIGVANGRYVGGGFPLAGQAMLDDGLLDVILVPELPTLELLAAGLNYVLGRSADTGGVIVKRARRIEVHSQPEMPFSLDGEATLGFDSLFEIVPAGLRVVGGDHPEAITRGLLSTKPQA